MTGYLKNACRLVRSVEAFEKSRARKGMMRLAERARYDAGRHRKSLNLG